MFSVELGITGLLKFLSKFVSTDFERIISFNFSREEEVV